MDASSVVSSSSFASVLSNIQNQISVSTIVEVLAVVVGATVGLAFMWWGVRKVISAMMKALKGRMGV